MAFRVSARCDVNLHTDILDTPDIFWDEETCVREAVSSQSALSAFETYGWFVYKGQ